MANKLELPALDPAQAPAVTGSAYPEPFKSRVATRRKQRLGDACGLKNFGDNITTIPAGAMSALRHWHSHEDEFIYVVSGELMLVTNNGEQKLTPGMCAGFPAGKADGHCLVNRSSRDAVYTRSRRPPPGRCRTYPDDYIAGRATSQGRRFTRKDRRPY
jgi:uncharacterized cupin superfamily protein